MFRGFLEEAAMIGLPELLFEAARPNKNPGLRDTLRQIATLFYLAICLAPLRRG